MSNSARLATLQTRLTAIQSAISGTLDRGVANYSINGRSVGSMSLTELIKLETSTVNEIARLQRGSRFSPIGFKRVAS